MSDLLVPVWDRLEAAVPENVFLRAAMGAALGWMLIAAVRPSFAYAPNGEARQDAIFPELFPGAAPPTTTPWWVGPVAGATTFVLFI